MPSNEYIDIKSLDGLYDENTEHRSYNILKDKICIRHDWVNAFLRWEKDGYSVDFDMEKENNHLRTVIRFCRSCFKISCIHYWEKTISYRIWINKLDYDVFHIRHCKRCGRAIYDTGCRVINSYGIDAETGNKIDLSNINCYVEK